MRWKNKGHELDEIGLRFRQVNKIYIYGAGEYGKETYNILKNLNIAITFIDLDLEKQRTGYCNCIVQSPQHLINLKDKKSQFIIVVAMKKQNSLMVLNNLSSLGYKQNEDYFDYDIWKNTYVSIFFWYCCNKIFIKYLDLPVTQYCNLKCKECSILTPYIHHPKHRNLESLKRDLELLFCNVDLIETLFLIGGEPILYSDLDNLCRYIGQNYRNKIVHITIATNGTVKINRDLLDIIKQYEIEVQISDYSLNVVGAKEKIDSFCEILSKENIHFLRMVDFQWCDYGFLYQKNIKKDENEMIDFFDTCKIDCRGIEDRKLFYCFPAQMVYKVLNMDIKSNMYLELNEKINRTELFEFNMGFSEKGYMDMCRRCNGSYLVNDNYIAVAEQL